MIHDRDAIQSSATATATARAPRQPAAGTGAAEAPRTAAEPEAAPPQPGVPMVNPRMRIETALNLVVLEFRDADGALSRSIPSPREIDAYRSGLQDRAPTKKEIDLEG
jgi:hypothetical protein